MRLPGSRNAKPGRGGFIASEISFDVNAVYYPSELQAALDVAPEKEKRQSNATPPAVADNCDALNELAKLARGDRRKKRTELDEQRKRLCRALWILGRAGWASGEHEKWQQVCASILACAEPRDFVSADGTDHRLLPAFVTQEEAANLVHLFSATAPAAYSRDRVNQRLAAGLGGKREGCGLPSLENKAKQAVENLRTAGLPPSEWEPPGFAKPSQHEMLDVVEQMAERMREANTARSTGLPSNPSTPEGITQTASVEVAITLGERKLAQAFVAEHAATLRRIAGTKHWLRWHSDRHCWERVDSETVLALVGDVAQSLFEQANQAFWANPTASAAKSAYKDAAALVSNTARLRGALAQAAGNERIIVQPDRLDSRKHLLGVQNGVLNLKDGSFRAGVWRDLITRQAGCAWDADAQCPLWLAFLNQTFGNDQELIDWLQLWVGYCLTGEVSEEAVLLCFGHGANGKSIFGNILHSLFGEQAVYVPSSILTGRSDDSEHQRARNALAGARLAQINELGSTERLNDEALKSLASNEPLAVRELRCETRTIIPTAKVIARSNFKPAVHDHSEGMWRRLKLVPFMNTILAEQQDTQLATKLREELPGILRWAVDGAVRYYRQKGQRIADPKAVRDASLEYRQETDILGQFLEEATEQTTTTEADLAHVYTAYRNWCETAGLRPLVKQTVSKQLQERGLKIRRSTNGKKLVGGLKLLPQARAPMLA